jgi:hypothetical protein
MNAKIGRFPAHLVPNSYDPIQLAVTTTPSSMDALRTLNEKHLKAEVQNHFVCRCHAPPRFAVAPTENRCVHLKKGKKKKTIAL